LLGFASSKSLVVSVRTFGSRVFGTLSFLAEGIFHAAAGVILTSRVVSRGLIADSRGATAVGLLLVVLAIAFLSRLIARYHRTRVIE
jgi:hypothetical protein